MENPVSERMRDYEIERAVKEREKSLFEEELINYQKEIRKRALKILKKRDPIKYILKEHQKLHVGNEGVAKLLLLSIGCQFMKDSKGLQVSISGKSGKGKTHCCRSMLRLMPKEYAVDASYSDKAVFYDPELKEGTIIFIDDIDLTKELETTIKRTTSNFQGKTSHRRTTGNSVIEPSVPPRIAWWLTSVDEKYSDELIDRIFKIKIDESPEQDKRVNDHIKELARTGNKEFTTTKAIGICREIIKIIKSEKLFKIIIPYSDNIKFNNMRDRRKFDMFFDIVRAFSVFNYKQRKTDDEGYLIADIDDFSDAAEFYNKYGIVYRFELNAQEIKICEILQQDHNIPLRTYPDEYTIMDIVNRTKLSVSRIRQIINRIEKEFEGLGVFIRTHDKTGGGNTDYFSLDNFDLKLGSLDYVRYVSSDKDEEVDKEEVDKK